jgi:hypothetical protein
MQGEWPLPILTPRSQILLEEWVEACVFFGITTVQGLGAPEGAVAGPIMKEALEEAQRRLDVQRQEPFRRVDFLQEIRGRLNVLHSGPQVPGHPS